MLLNILFFYYNTNPPLEQVFLLFVYKILLSIYAQLHNSSHYLKVGEFLLSFVKRANGDTVNEELDYQIKVATAKLSSFGVNVEDLTL